MKLVCYLIPSLSVKMSMNKCIGEKFVLNRFLSLHASKPSYYKCLQTVVCYRLKQHVNTQFLCLSSEHNADKELEIKSNVELLYFNSNFDINRNTSVDKSHLFGINLTSNVNI